MNNLVFLEPNKLDAVPFTTSEVIAEYVGIQHHTVTRLIRKHQGDFEEFGLLGFKIHAVEQPGARGTKYNKIYHLNEGQATLLMTYLKNTEPVRNFKKELVRQFYDMRTELMNRKDRRAELKPIRRELTDVIQDNPNHSKWDFKHYTDLAYKTTIGKNAAQLRKERDAPKKAKAVDYMTAEEIAAVTKRQGQFAVLLEMGMDYQQIKMLVSGQVPQIVSQCR